MRGPASRIGGTAPTSALANGVLAPNSSTATSAANTEGSILIEALTPAYSSARAQLEIGSIPFR